MLELEKTYLIKNLPEGLLDAPSKKIIDIYFPLASAHPQLRLRQNGDKFEMTKKQPVDTDASEQIEQTIILSAEEFQALQQVAGKKIVKNRYYYPINGRTAEVDVFLEDLSGLVLVDFEFTSIEEKNSFALPDFCLAEITQEDFIAGGILAGKRYEDIEENLSRFNYQKIVTN